MQSKKIFKIVFFVVCLLFSTSFYGDATYLTTQEIWDNMSDEVDHWTDALGYPIDKEIKEIVIALNLMGVKTIASCEGHLDWGYAYPWVDVEITSPETEKCLRAIKQINEQIEIEDKSLEDQYPDLSPPMRLDLPEAKQLRALNYERFILWKTYDQAKMNCLESLNILLNQFYENRDISYDRVLVIVKDRLQSVGAYRQMIRSEEEQILKLIEYREEMQAFSNFLKLKFMN